MTRRRLRRVSAALRRAARILTPTGYAALMAVAAVSSLPFLLS